MRTQSEREAAAAWLTEQHRQFFAVEEVLNADFCHQCNRIVETSHDAEAHLAITQ